MGAERLASIGMRYADWGLGSLLLDKNMGLLLFNRRAAELRRVGEVQKTLLSKTQRFTAPSAVSLSLLV